MQINFKANRRRVSSWHLICIGILFLVITTSVIIRWRELSLEGVANPSSYTPVADFTVHLDDPRCLSRTQQLLLRSKAKPPHIPLPLREEWIRYAKRHSRCSAAKNWSEAFGETHGEDGEQMGCKYVIFLDAEVVGLGNRFAGLVSAFSYAMATDRALLVDNRRRLGDLLCEPFNGSSWLLSRDNFPFQQVKQNTATFPQFMQDNRSIIVRVRLRDDPRTDNLELFCGDIYDTLAMVPWIVWDSNIYTSPNLFLVSSFWQRMKMLFPDPEQVFALISRLIIFPSNEVWSIVLKEYQTYLSGADSIVGVQVRPHGQDPYAFHGFANTMLTECLESNSYIPKLAPRIMNATEVATLYSNKLRSGRQAGEVDVAILMTSLNGEYVRKMKRRYSGKRGTVEGNLVRVHAVSELKRQDSTYRQAVLAFAEMILLSYSDLLATSASSTFGYAAISWANVRPLIVDLGQRQEADGSWLSRSCRAGYSVSPCSHLHDKPPCVLNSNMTFDHKRWIKRHLRWCQDRPQAGWQLVRSSSPEILPPVFDFDDDFKK